MTTNRVDMPPVLERTCWRGVRVDHPRDWEIALAAGPNEPPRCAFADRHFHRLDVRWQEIKGPPNLELLLEKHRQSPSGQMREVSRLGGLPAGWSGLLRQGDGGCVTYAAKVFRDRKVLTEAMLFWPGRRDAALEAAVLDSVTVEAPAAVRQWQAMGIHLELGAEFALTASGSRVGRVTWQFAAAGRDAPRLTVERLAMPDVWLKCPLDNWITEQTIEHYVTLDKAPATFNGHPARRQLARAKGHPIDKLRRRQKLRLDLAWLCPRENRLYHLVVEQRRRDEQLQLPPSLVVRCCRPTPHVGAGAGRPA